MKISATTCDDLCYPVTARILLACALLAGAFAVYAMFTA